MKPLAIDLFSGLGGWTDGMLSEGYEVVGFDVERHRGPDGKGYPAQLVLQDVLTIRGSQFRDAALIVASPPCQNYSYLAMPWSRSKDPNNSKAAKALLLKWETEGPDNRLFDACFRIQREANIATGYICEACGAPDEPRVEMTAPAGYCHEDDLAEYAPCSECLHKSQRFIPLVVENVRGAQPWVGRSAWSFGSFHLWGDVPALMPINLKRGVKLGGGRSWSDFGKPGYVPFGFNMENEKALAGQKVPAYSDPRRNGGKGVHPTSPQENADGTKIGGDWFSDPNSTCRKHGSRSNARKMASAMIAKIPLELSSHIARVYYPR